MSSRTELLLQQRNWAESSGLEPDARGYLLDVALSLLRPINAKTKSAFENGSGSELQDTPTRKAKMKALHSSSALAVNVFDSWVSRDKTALQGALQIDTAISSISFEEQFPTGLMGNPPNLYMYLELPGKESNMHIEEVSQFASFVGAELGFKAITYQQLLSSLQREQGADSEYLDYLRKRYCGG